MIRTPPRDVVGPAQSDTERRIEAAIRIAGPAGSFVSASTEQQTPVATGNVVSCADEYTMSAINDYQFDGQEDTPTAAELISNIGREARNAKRARAQDIAAQRQQSGQDSQEFLDDLLTNVSQQESRNTLIEESINSLISLTNSTDAIIDSAADFGTSQVLGLGRNNLLINSKLFGGSTSNLTDNFLLESPITADKIRYYTNSLYSLEQNQKVVFFKNVASDKYLELFAAYRQEELVNEPLGKFKQLYAFKYGANLRALETQKQTALNTAFLYGGDFTGSINSQNKTVFSFNPLTNFQETYYDISFNLQAPFLNTEILNSLNLVGGKILDINPEYSFYLNQYEKIANINNISSKENIFPNLYIFNELLKEKDDKEDGFYNSLVTLNNTIPFSRDSVTSIDVQNSRSVRIINQVKKKIGKYFDLFGFNYNTLASREPQILQVFSNKNKNIILLSDTVKNLKQINEQKYLFPMNIQISVPTDKVTNVTQIINSSGLIDQFLMKLFDVTKQGGFQPVETIISEQIIEQNIQQQNNNYVEPTITNTFGAKRTGVLFYPFESIMDEMLNSPSPENEQEYTLIGDRDNIINNSSGNIFENNLKMLILRSKLEDFMKNNLRNYGDIINGKLAYNETMAYRVSKYDNVNNEPIQNYWFMNDSSQEFIKFFDTQVKYNKEYTYKIFAYQFVLGNKYRTQVVPTDVLEDMFYMLSYQDYYPNIAEVELLSSNVRIVDSPPLSPEVLFIPYNRSDNKIGISLNGRTGEETLEPITITRSDDNIINFYNKNLQNKVKYRSDDVPKEFHLFKLESKPKKYSDFNNGVIKRISTLLDSNTQTFAPAGMHIDNIQPNKKYYYTFRTADIHDNISNPSPIYEVEIINDKGAILPIIKLFEFEKPKYDTSKKLRRFIKIQPAIQHVRMNSEDVDLQNTLTARDAMQKISLGTSNVAVPWGKTFKMVLTSIQSGKKLEIKFKFNYKTQ